MELSLVSVVAERLVELDRLDGLEDEELCSLAVGLAAGFAAGRVHEPCIINFAATSKGTSVSGSAVASWASVISGGAMLSVFEPGTVVCGCAMLSVVEPGTVICKGVVFAVAPVPVAAAPAAAVVPC